MITNTPLQFSVLWASILSWINISSPLILFGLYYGFLTTLPIGPSQILTIRAFLLEGNLSGTVAVSGLILGQLIIFLSIYYSPLYTILLKPHTVTLLVLPYLLFYWYRIKDLLDYQSLRPINSIKDSRTYKIFFDSFIFQLLNPVLLPSPILARLINLFFFRYSNNFLFVLSCFFGWLSGHLFFFKCVKFLLIRIEKDSPILYLLVKRIIYQTFSIFILACILLYLGRAPVPLFTKKLNDELQFNKSGFSLLNKPWPTFFFDYYRWNRPLRYIENSRFTNKSPVKKSVSQYFFNVSLSDGKQKISFTALPSLSIFEKDLKTYLNISTNNNNLYKNWLDTKNERKNNLLYELENRIQALDNGLVIKEVIEKKTCLSNNEGINFTKINDPFLNGSFRGKAIIAKSPWLFKENPYKLKRNKKIVYLKENKLKIWISTRWRELKRKNLPLAWEPLNKNARRSLVLLIQGSKNKKLKRKLQQIHFSEEQVLTNLNKQNNISDLTEKLENKNLINKKLTKTSHFNWELVLNLSPRQRAIYFKELEYEKWQILVRSWKNLLQINSINSTQLNKFILLLKKLFTFHKKFALQEISKELPRWTSKLRNDKFDVIAIGITDIRQRKVKNLGYLIKGKEKRRKIVRRFSQQSDFRRRLVKGSMRSRRRKTLIWKILQLKTHSPFFLRINEKHIPFEISLNKLNLIDIKHVFKNPIEKQKKLVLSSTKNNVTLKKKTKADRLAIANRWDFPLAQWGRSWLLLIQSYFRKYLILPTLIISKNIIRLLLFQTPEWSEDWNDWNKEMYIKCTYDGIEVSEKALPEQWLRDGLQIKIIYPFILKPWHNAPIETNIKKKLNNVINTNDNFSKNIKNKKIKYSYLTAWGFETNAPFGDIKKKPSFWKPIRKELKKKWKKNVLFNFNKVYSKFNLLKKKITNNSINNESKDLVKVNIEINHNFEVNLNNKNYNKNLPEQNLPKISETVLSENQIKNKYKVLTNIQKLENLKSLKKYKIETITKKFDFDKIEFFNKLKTDNKNYFTNKQRNFENKQKLIKYYKKNILLVKKWPYFFKLSFNKLNKKFFQFYIYIIRFNINLISKIQQNLILIKNGKIWNPSKVFQTNQEKNKINYKYSNDFDEKIQSLKTNVNQENILLMSQAYLFHKIWQIETTNKKYDFKYLLKNWTSDLVIKKKINRNLKKIDFKFLKEQKWKNWLQTFNRYNLSSQVWDKIAPQKWKTQINYQWKEKEYHNLKNSEKQIKILNLSKEKTFFYKLSIDSLLEQNKKISKRYKYNYLCYSYLDFKKQSNFIESKKNKTESLLNNKILQISKNQIINNYKKDNLILWLIPTFTEKKSINKFETIDVNNISLLKEKSKKNNRNKKTLRERERHETIRQWKWKSKNIEKRFKELGDMASLMTFMQDQENSVSLSAKMRENLDLFRLLFCRDIGVNKLTINSEHRLPRVLDDQILMYKVVSLFLKSKNRFKKHVDLTNFNLSTSRIELFQNTNQNNNFNLINLEDIMLLKHRKELKILNLLDLKQNTKTTSDFNKVILKENKKKTIELNKIQNKNQNVTIKHFLWPSFRLEDLACVNRFWFNTSNGSRFTMLRIRMYT